MSDNAYSTIYMILSLNFVDRSIKQPPKAWKFLVFVRLSKLTLIQTFVH